MSYTPYKQAKIFQNYCVSYQSPPLHLRYCQSLNSKSGLQIKCILLFPSQKLFEDIENSIFTACSQKSMVMSYLY